MWLLVGTLGVVVFLFLLRDLLNRIPGGEDQGDQDKRDKGELPYDYYKKGK